MRAVLPVIYRGTPGSPPRGAQIDRNHPLAEGMIGFWTFGDGLLSPNLLTGTQLVLPGAHITIPYDGQGERGVDFAAAFTPNVPLLPGALMAPGLPATLAGRVNLRSLTTAAQTLWGTRTRDAVNSSDGLYMLVNSSGTLLCDAGAGGGTGSANLRRRNSSVNLTINKWFTVGCSYRSFASDFFVYIDGIDRTGTSVGTGAALSNTTGVPAMWAKQASTAGIGYGDYRCQWFGMWSRALSADEHAELAHNPFAMFSLPRNLGVTSFFRVQRNPAINHQNPAFV